MYYLWFNVGVNCVELIHFIYQEKKWIGVKFLLTPFHPGDTFLIYLF